MLSRCYQGGADLVTLATWPRVVARTSCTWAAGTLIVPSCGKGTHWVARALDGWHPVTTNVLGTCGHAACNGYNNHCRCGSPAYGMFGTKWVCVPMYGTRCSVGCRVGLQKAQLASHSICFTMAASKGYYAVHSVYVVTVMMRLLAWQGAESKTGHVTALEYGIKGH